MKCKTMSVWILSILVFTVFSGIAIMRVAAASTWYVDGVSGLDTNSGGSLDPFKTITKAIAVASDGDTIMVAATTYNEEVDITKGLSIIGAGAATTIIDGAGVAAQATGLVTITATTDDVVFSGFTVKNAFSSSLGNSLMNNRFEIYASGAVPGVTYTISDCNLYGTNNPDEEEDYGFYNSGDSANAVFTHNMITQTGANAILVEVCTGATEISFNTLDPGCYGCDAIFFMTHNGIDVTALQNVSYNTFDMSTGGTFNYDHRASAISFNTWPIAPDAKFTNVVIQGNTITNLESYRRGIGFWNGGGSGGGVISPLVGDNTVTGLTGRTESYGIDFVGANAATNAAVTNNVISNCAYGIYLKDADCAPGVKIHYNNIAGNSAGLDNTAGVSAVDAQYNWWGSSTGPYDPTSNPLGTGDPVTANVNYTAYLTSPVPSALYTSPTSVSKAPSDVGKTFTVAIMLSQFSYLMGFEINLTWDNSLITFVSTDKTPLSTLWGPGGWNVSQSGTGYYNLSAASTSNPASNTGASVLFNVAFQVAAKLTSPLSTPIHFALVKLANNETPPNSIPAIVTDGTYTMSTTVPGIEFKVEKWAPGWEFDTAGPPYHFERDGYFHVDVYVTNVGGLTGYNLTVDFTSGTVAFMGLEMVYSVSPYSWGIFGKGNVSYTPGTPSAIQVNGSAPAGSAWSGSEGLLFALRFHVEFDATQAHIWKYGKVIDETFQYSIAEATLYFGSLGIILKSGITTPSDRGIEVDFIRGDVDCNGVVNMVDISEVAYYYHRISTDPSWSSTISKYDLNDDGIIDIYDIVTTATNYGYGT